jgi:predicted RNase H-like nuclease
LEGERQRTTISAVRALGIDGWRGGWVGVVVDRAGFVTAAAEPLIADLVVQLPADVVGVDIPIGLPEIPPRPCDTATRAFVGARRSSVFPAPPDDVISAPTYGEALARSRRRYGAGLSRQAYALRSKILETADLVAGGVEVFEIHPEASFRAMAGSPLPWSKRTWNGMRLRQRLLLQQGIELPDELEPGVVPVDDMLDAAAVAWSARRIAHGDGATLPPDPPRGADGRLIAIWY